MARALFCVLLMLWSTLGAPSALAAKSSRDTAEDGETDLCKEAVYSWLGNVGQVVGAIDDGVIDPIIEYHTTTHDDGREEERRVAKIKKSLEGGIKILCPTCGVVIDGGRFIVGQIAMNIEEFYAQGRRISAGRMIFGGSKPIDAYLGGIDRLLTSASFFGDFLARRSPPITPDNFGQRVGSAESLRRLWFTDYRRFLVSRFGGLPTMEGEIDGALQRGWPLLERLWAAQRAGQVLDKLSDTFPSLRMPCSGLAKSVANALAPPKTPLECPMPNAQPVWREAEQREVCACTPGHLWNAARTACILEPAAQVATLRCAPGAQPRWDIPSEQAVCDCRPGLSWNRANTACIPDPAEAVAAARCQPNAEAYWNDELEKVRCRCTAGKAWNVERTACVSQVAAQIATAPCEKLYPNSETYADKDGKAACRCKTGFAWNRPKAACLAPEKPDRDLSKLLDDVNADAGNASAADRGERTAANDARDKAQVGSDGPSTLRQQADGPNLMTALLQGLTIAVAQSQGVPVPGGLPIPGLALPTGRPAAAPQTGKAPAPTGPKGTGTPAAGGDEIYMITASALPTSNENYRKYPACRYQTPVVRSAFVSDVPGGKQEIEAAANALRARGRDAVQVWYYPASRGVAPFQEWDRIDQAGYDACWKATRNTSGGR